jgi:hypothetical protein
LAKLGFTFPGDQLSVFKAYAFGIIAEEISNQDRKAMKDQKQGANG